MTTTPPDTTLPGDVPSTSRTLWIPVLGDMLRVVEPWETSLMEESRNNPLLKKLGHVAQRLPKGWEERKPSCPVTFPAGTVLVFDRFYIRQGKEGWNSVTFRVKECAGDPRLNKGRFWVSIDDANTIRYEQVDRVAFDQAREEKKTRQIENAQLHQAFIGSLKTMMASNTDLVSRVNETLLARKVNTGNLTVENRIKNNLWWNQVPRRCKNKTKKVQCMFQCGTVSKAIAGYQYGTTKTMKVVLDVDVTFDADSNPVSVTLTGVAIQAY